MGAALVTLLFEVPEIGSARVHHVAAAVTWGFQAPHLLVALVIRRGRASAPERARVCMLPTRSWLLLIADNLQNELNLPRIRWISQWQNNLSAIEDWLHILVVEEQRLHK